MKKETEKKKEGFKKRITLSIIFALAAFIAICIFILSVFFFSSKKYAESELESVGTVLVKNMVYSLDLGIITEDPEFLKKPFMSLLKVKNMNWVGAYNKEGQLISGEGEYPEKAEDREFLPPETITELEAKDIIHVKSGTELSFYSSVFTEEDGVRTKIGYIKIVMSRKAVLKSLRTISHISILLLFLIIAVTFGAYQFVLKNLFDGYGKIKAAIFELAQGKGDLTYRIEYTVKDELGEITQYLNQFLDMLEKLVSKIFQISGNILDYSENLSSAAEEMSASTQEISSTIEELSDGMMHQSEKVENVKNFIKKVADFAMSIRDGSQKTLDSFDELVNLANDSKNEVKKSLSSLSEVRELFVNIEQLINELTNLSNQVGEFVSSIKNIANQTNLLALNAAIEAARAGEAGKGFTVVAEQVKKLSEQSSLESEKVEVTISKVQKQVQTLANTITNGREVIKGLSSLSANTEDSFLKISGGINSANENLNEINGMIQQQVDETNQISEAMLEIAAISEEGAASTEQASSSTEEQAASMEELSAAAIELANIAKNLKKQVDQFKVNLGNAEN